MNAEFKDIACLRSFDLRSTDDGGGGDGLGNLSIGFDDLTLSNEKIFLKNERFFEESGDGDVCDEGDVEIAEKYVVIVDAVSKGTGWNEDCFRMLSRFSGWI